ncbi:MAG: CBS domain-containing protein [Gaiellaceae bacterium]
MQVKDVMTRDVIWVEPTAPLRDAVALLVRHRISGMPVVADGVVVGVISKRDVLFKEQQPLNVDGWRARLIDPLIARKSAKPDARVVSEAMTAPAVTIGPGTSLALAARRMLEEGVSRLPVIANGELVGMLSSSDLVRAFVRPDGEIEREITEDVLGRQLLLDHHVVEASVTDGNVVLRGAAPGIEPGWIERLVRCVPGVVSVMTDGR